MSDDSSRLPGLHKLDVEARRGQVAEHTGVDAAQLSRLDAGGLDLDVADAMIENVIGTFALPMGIAPNFLTDGIQRGHLSLHARVVARSAEARGALLDRLAAEIAALGDVRPERAQEILARRRDTELASALASSHEECP